MSFFFKRWPKNNEDETIETLNSSIPKYRINRTDFVVIKLINNSIQSTVNLVRNKSNKKEYIEKVINHVEKDQNSFFTEIMILASNMSPLLSSLYGYDYIINEKDNSITGYIYMYKLGKSLEDYINEHLLNVTEKTIIAYGVSYALSILHKNHIMYRDLKPSNILLDENKYPILIDFGVSLRTENDELKPYGEVGTQLYCPPEQINGNPYNSKVDNFSYGKLLYILGLEKDPNPGYLNINEINESPRFSDGMKTIIESLNSSEPESRYSFDQISEMILYSQAYFIDPEGNDKINTNIIDNYYDFLENIHANLSLIQEAQCNAAFLEMKFTEYEAQILVQRMYQDLLLRSPKMTLSRAISYSNFIESKIIFQENQKVFKTPSLEFDFTRCFVDNDVENLSLAIFQNSDKIKDPQNYTIEKSLDSSFNIVIDKSTGERYLEKSGEISINNKNQSEKYPFREISVLSKTNHQSLLSLEGFYINFERTRYHIYSPYISDFTLSNYIQQNDQIYDQEDFDEFQTMARRMDDNPIYDIKATIKSETYQTIDDEEGLEEFDRSKIKRYDEITPAPEPEKIIKLPSMSGGFIPPKMTGGFIPPKMTGGSVEAEPEKITKPPSMSGGFIPPKMTGGSVEAEPEKITKPPSMSGGFIPPKMTGGFIPPKMTGGSVAPEPEKITKPHGIETEQMTKRPLTSIQSPDDLLETEHSKPATLLDNAAVSEISTSMKSFLYRTDLIPLSSTQKTAIMMVIAYGFKKLQSNMFNIIHKNLTPYNVLLYKNTYFPVIINFGGSKKFRERDNLESYFTALSGTQTTSPEQFSQIVNGFTYAAPEINSEVSTKTDVYSYGRILYALVLGSHPPFPANHEELEKQINDINSLTIPKNLKLLIQRTIDPEPEKRPTFTEIYNLFKTHEVMFENTNPSEIDYVVRNLEKDDGQIFSIDGKDVLVDISVFNKFKQLTNSDSSQTIVNLLDSITYIPDQYIPDIQTGVNTILNDKDNLPSPDIIHHIFKLIFNYPKQITLPIPLLNQISNEIDFQKEVFQYAEQNKVDISFNPDTYVRFFNTSEYAKLKVLELSKTPSLKYILKKQFKPDATDNYKMQLVCNISTNPVFITDYLSSKDISFVLDTLLNLEISEDNYHFIYDFFNNIFSVSKENNIDISETLVEFVNNLENKSKTKSLFTNLFSFSLRIGSVKAKDGSSFDLKDIFINFMNQIVSFLPSKCFENKSNLKVKFIKDYHKCEDKYEIFTKTIKKTKRRK